MVSPFFKLLKSNLHNQTYPLIESPLGVEYALSKTGESMHPILNAMKEWASIIRNPSGNNFCQ